MSFSFQTLLEMFYFFVSLFESLPLVKSFDPNILHLSLFTHFASSV